MSIKIESLHIYPVKSCGGISLQSATITNRGFDYDRMWIIVDSAGKKVTQREYPRLALVTPEIHNDYLILRAPHIHELQISRKQLHV